MVLTSANFAKWAGQIDVEFLRVTSSMDSKLAAVSEALSSVHEMATACADQVAKFDVVRLFVDNKFGRVAAL